MSELLCVTVKAIDEKKGNDIKIIDLQSLSPLTDYFVIADVNNSKMMRAVIDNIIEKAEKAGYVIRAIEGQEDSGWQLIDMYDVIVHIFLPEQRYFYNLEKLWGDMPEVDLNEIL